MKTFIGIARCSRCHGGSSPCPVCDTPEPGRIQVLIESDAPVWRWCLEVMPGDCVTSIYPTRALTEEYLDEARNLCPDYKFRLETP